MDANPYEAPKTREASDSKSAARIIADSTLEIVRSQRGMMWLFLAKIGMDFTVGIARELLSGPPWMAFLCSFLAVNIAIAYFVFRLSNAIYGIGPGIVCFALTLAPCLGTFTVLVLNGNAMDCLRKSGVKVGFMGATKSQLAELAAARNDQSELGQSG